MLLQVFCDHTLLLTAPEQLGLLNHGIRLFIKSIPVAVGAGRHSCGNNGVAAFAHFEIFRRRNDLGRLAGAFGKVLIGFTHTLHYRSALWFDKRQNVKQRGIPPPRRGGADQSSPCHV